MYTLPPCMDAVLRKTINEMGGNIPSENFPGGIFHGAVGWVGILQGRIFVELSTDRLSLLLVKFDNRPLLSSTCWF